MILANPNDWIREIVAIGSQQNIRNLEAEILVLFDAQNDKRSLNQYNQNGKFICFGHSIETIEKIKKNSKWAGKNRPEHSEIMKGKKRKPEDVKKWADKLRGKPFTQEHIDALKKSFRKLDSDQTIALAILNVIKKFIGESKWSTGKYVLEI